MLAFELMVHFLFSLEDTLSMISKNNLKPELVRPQHNFPLHFVDVEIVVLGVTVLNVTVFVASVH